MTEFVHYNTAAVVEISSEAHAHAANRRSSSVAACLASSVSRTRVGELVYGSPDQTLYWPAGSRETKAGARLTPGFHDGSTIQVTLSSTEDGQFTLTEYTGPATRPIDDRIDL
jgi:hypothetical protein